MRSCLLLLVVGIGQVSALLLERVAVRRTSTTRISSLPLRLRGGQPALTEVQRDGRSLWGVAGGLGDQVSRTPGTCAPLSWASGSTAERINGHGPGLLRLRGGKKGTSSQGKRGTGSKSHPYYKYNLSQPRKTRATKSKRKRYTIKKNPEGQGRMAHLRLVHQRFKNGFRSGPPCTGKTKISKPLVDMSKWPEYFEA